jgi:hypothetical protein
LLHILLLLQDERVRAAVNDSVSRLNTTLVRGDVFRLC